MAEPSRRAAVLGQPIAHSLSPLLHRAAYAELGLDWTYDAIECDAAGLATVLADRADWAGFSCTMPLKRAAFEIAREYSSAARAVGAANTLLPHPDGGWTADNTDVAGIVAAVRESGAAPRTVTLLGAGGTAQAALAAARELGIEGCSSLVRDRTRTGELQATAHRLGIDLAIGDLDVSAPELGADLVVSTLPRSAADPFAAAHWKPAQVVLDVVYEPWPTLLARGARDAGATVLGGALMLLHQAAAQVELMTARPAPVAAMRTALRTARPETSL